MPRRNRVFCGLDIGTTKVCAAIGEETERGALRMIGVGVTGCAALADGAIRHLDDVSEATRIAVNKAQEMAQRQIHHVTVGIAGRGLISLNASASVPVANPLRGVTEKDRLSVLEKARNSFVRPDGTEVIHAIPRYYTINSTTQVQNPLTLASDTLGVSLHVVMAPVTASANFYKCVRNARLQTSSIVLQSIASAEALLTEQEREHGVLLIDFGGGTSDYVAYRDGAIMASGSEPTAGDRVTNEISQFYHCSRDEAEKIKQRYARVTEEGGGPDEMFEVTQLIDNRKVMFQRRELDMIARWNMAQTVKRIGKSIEATGTDLSTFGAGVKITGGSSLLRGLPELVEHILDLPTTLGRPIGIEGLDATVKSPIHSTAMGLLIHAFSQGNESRLDAQERPGIFQWGYRKVRRFLDWYGAQPQ